MPERQWYPLDGTWHQSMASRLSALHLSVNDEGKVAICNPQRTVLLDDMPYDEKEAERCGRTLCQRCLRKSATDSEGLVK